jgi:hypothetical protein
MSRYRCVPSSAVAVVFLASFAIVGALLARGGGGEPTGDNSSAKPAAFQRIESPRVDDKPNVADQVAVLRMRVEALESRLATLERAVQSPIAPSPIGRFGNLDNWRPFEFNGRTNYLGPDLVVFPETKVEAVSGPRIILGHVEVRSEDSIGVPSGTSELNWGPTNQFLDQTLLKYEPLPSEGK